MKPTAGEVSGIIGNCAAVQDVSQQMRHVAGTDATVMLQGESGTVKTSTLADAVEQAERTALIAALAAY